MSDRVEITSARFVLPGTAEQAAGNSLGSWRGETVRPAAPSMLDLLASAKEELTFGHSERIEQKSLRERKVHTPGTSTLEQVQQIRDAQAATERLPDLDEARLAEWVATAGQADRNPAAMLESVRRRFEDPSHAHAALAAAERALEDKGDTEGAAIAAAARILLLEAEGPAVRAGLNVSVAAHAVAKGDAQATSDLRNLYRAAVLEDPAPVAIYRAVIARFGVDQFDEHLAFLARAIGDDLRAAGPSIEPARLREVLDGLSGIKVLTTVHERVATTAARVGKLSGTPLAAKDVLGALLPLTELATFGAGAVSAIPDRLGIPANRLDAQILTMQEMRAVTALLPLSVWRDNESRFATLRSIQEFTDVLIEREEAAA